MLKMIHCLFEIQIQKSLGTHLPKNNSYKSVVCLKSRFACTPCLCWLSLQPGA